MKKASGTPIDDLRREHANMRSVLMVVARQLDKLEKMGATDSVLLANAVYYMRNFPGHVHHPKEDLIFARLGHADAAWKPEVDKVRMQHQEIYALEEELIELISENPPPASEASARLLGQGRRYLQLQRQHSESEERMLFPQALATLKPRDWAAMAGQIDRVDDPLFGKHVGTRYRLLYEHIMREADED
jgi:hemerythrin-like domain-containing protein